MKILVGVKQVVDPNVRIRVRADGQGVDLDNVKLAINPFDEIAVEEAVRLKEAGLADEVVLVSIGPARAVEVLRVGLAMGADRGLLIRAEGRIEPLAVAKLLRAVVAEETPDLVLLGKQAIDDDSNQTGQMLAALLGWPQATFASAVALADGAAEVTREIDAGMQTVKVSLPAVVTTDLRLNEPRHLALPKIMMAKKKPVEERPVEAFDVDVTPRHRILSTEEPPAREGGQRVGSVDELLDKLRNEAGVL
jgi:electron transfer flavoprotein beta subunit